PSVASPSGPWSGGPRRGGGLHRLRRTRGPGRPGHQRLLVPRLARPPRRLQPPRRRLQIAPPEPPPPRPPGERPRPRRPPARAPAAAFTAVVHEPRLRMLLHAARLERRDVVLEPFRREAPDELLPPLHLA